MNKLIMRYIYAFLIKYEVAEKLFSQANFRIENEHDLFYCGNDLYAFLPPKGCVRKEKITTIPFGVILDYVIYDYNEFVQIQSEVEDSINSLFDHFQVKRQITNKVIIKKKFLFFSEKVLTERSHVWNCPFSIVNLNSNDVFFSGKK